MQKDLGRWCRCKIMGVVKHIHITPMLVMGRSRGRRLTRNSWQPPSLQVQQGNLSQEIKVESEGEEHAISFPRTYPDRTYTGLYHTHTHTHIWLNYKCNATYLRILPFISLGDHNQLSRSSSRWLSLLLCRGNLSYVCVSVTTHRTTPLVSCL